MRFRMITSASLLALVLALVVMPQSVLAHEPKDVNKYHMEVGFFIEPAIEGQMNGIDLRVNNNSTEKPVTGLETTLQVEITSISTNASQIFSIEPVDPDGDPGHYNNGFIPTMPGQYRFRFFGNIEGTPVNETFSSGPNTFSDVLEAIGVEFPLKLASQRELDSVTRTSQVEAQNARSAASRATTLAAIATALGVIGIGTGAWALMVTRKK